MALRDSLQLDIRPYLQALKKAEGAFADFQKDTKKEAAAAAGALKDGARSSVQAAKTQTKAIRGLSGSLKTLTSEAAREMQRLQQSAKLGLISEKEARRQMRRVQTRVAQFVRKVSSSLDEIPDTLRQDMSAAVDTVGADLRRVGGTAEREAKKGQGAWGRFTGFMEDSATRIKLAMAAAFAAIGFAAERSLNTSLRSAAELDQAMTDSLAIMRGRSDELDRLMKQRARDLGKELAFQPAEVARGYEYLALAGYEAAEAYELIGETARFARAGNFDLARATDLVTDSQSALGLTSEDTAENLQNMRRVQDGLIGASTAANATTEQFAEALISGAAPALRRVNKPLEEGLGLLALFADRGIKGAAAGEQFNIMLRDLPRAVGRNEEKFRALGLELTDQEGNLLDLATVVERMDTALARMGDTQKAAALEALGLTRGVGDALSTVSGGADQIREYTERIREMGGVTERVSDERMTSFTRRVTALGIAFKTLIETRLGVPAMERAGAVVDALSNNWDEAEETILSVVKTIGLLVGALAVAKTAQLAYIGYTKAAAAATATLRASMLLGQAALFLLQGRLTTARRAMILFTAAVRANPIGILVTALTAVGALFLSFPRRANAATTALKEQRQEVERLAESLRSLKGAQAAMTFTEAAEKRRSIEGRRSEVGSEIQRLEGAEEMRTMGPVRFQTSDGEVLGIGERANRLSSLRKEYAELGEQVTELAKAQRDAMAAGAGNLEFELGLLRERRDALAKQKTLTDGEIQRLETLNALIKEREDTLQARRSAPAEAASPSAPAPAIGIAPQEVQAASIEMLADAHGALEDARTRELTSLEKRARALEAQAELDGAYRASLLKTAGALREIDSEIQKQDALDQFERLQGRLQKLTGPEAGAYEGEIAALKSLADQHKHLAPEIAEVAQQYKRLQAIEAKGNETDAAVRIATARYALEETEERLADLESALIAQAKHWDRVAASAADGSEEQAQALERVAAAEEDLRSLQDSQAQSTDALAEARRLLAAANSQQALTIEEINRALQALEVAYQQADTDGERQRILRLIQALSYLNQTLMQTGQTTVSVWGAISDGIKANLGGAIADSVEAVAEAMTGLMDDSQSLGKNLIQILVDVAKQIGRLLIAMGTAELFVPGMQATGLAKIGAGIALIAAATVAQAAFGGGGGSGEDKRHLERPDRREDDLRGYEQGGLVVGSEQVIRINEVGEEYVMPHDKTKKYLGALEAMRAGRPPETIAAHLAGTTSKAGSLQTRLAGGPGAEEPLTGRMARPQDAGLAAAGAMADRLDAGIDRLAGSMPSKLEAKMDGRSLYVLVKRAEQTINDLHGK